MKIASALLVVSMGLWLGAPARGEEALPAPEAPAPAPETAATTPASAAAKDEIPPEVFEFFSSPGVAATLVVAIDYVGRHLAVMKGSLSGCTTGCILGAATPLALSLISPLVGGPKFEFAEIGGPLWAALPGAAIGAGLLAPLWATGEGIKYEHERGSFVGLAFPDVEDEVPGVIYRDAGTAAVLGIVSAAVPTAAGIGLLMLGGDGPANGWHFASIPFFAGALLVAPSVTNALYPDFVARHDPYVKAGSKVSEEDVAKFVDMIKKLAEEEKAKEEQEEKTGKKHGKHAGEEQEQDEDK